MYAQDEANISPGFQHVNFTWCLCRLTNSDFCFHFSDLQAIKIVADITSLCG